jgi:hypothetical protein
MGDIPGEVASYAGRRQILRQTAAIPRAAKRSNAGDMRHCEGFRRPGPSSAIELPRDYEKSMKT